MSPGGGVSNSSNSWKAAGRADGVASANRARSSAIPVTCGSSCSISSSRAWAPSVQSASRAASARSKSLSMRRCRIRNSKLCHWCVTVCAGGTPERSLIARVPMQEAGAASSGVSVGYSLSSSVSFLFLFLFFFVVFGARRDVIDVGEVVVRRTPVFVGVVESPDGTFLDRTSRPAIGVLARRFPFVLRRRVRTEVAAARRPRGAAGGVSSRRESSTRARSAETTWRARSRAAEAARPRAARPALFSRSRLADRERSSFERLLVESADRFFGDGSIRVVDEREAPRPSRFAIDRQYHLRWCADARQVLAQLCLRRRVRQIPNEQTD